jgi:hypothetical protein
MTGCILTLRPLRIEIVMSSMRYLQVDRSAHVSGAGATHMLLREAGVNSPIGENERAELNGTEAKCAKHVL